MNLTLRGGGGYNSNTELLRTNIQQPVANYLARKARAPFICLFVPLVYLFGTINIKFKK